MDINVLIYIFWFLTLATFIARECINEDTCCKSLIVFINLLLALATVALVITITIAIWLGKFC
jgi:hypothetical protein